MISDYFQRVTIISIVISFVQSFPNNENIVFATQVNSLKLNSECETTVHTLGTCKRVHDCPVERIKLNRRDICYFERNDPVVCCERDISGFPILAPIKNSNLTQIQNNFEINMNKKTINQTTDDEVYNSSAILSLKDQIFYDRIQNSNRLSNQYCVDYPPPKPGQRNPLMLVFLGPEVQAKRQDTPQMAAIGWRTLGDSVEWKCGGSLISENFVITSAHCIKENGPLPQVVRVGGTGIFQENLFSQGFNITKIWTHPEFQQQFLYNDISLLKIEPDAYFSAFTKPTCLWTDTDIPVTEFTALRYDKNSTANYDNEDELHELYMRNLSYVTNENCRNSFVSDSRIPSNGINDNQLCAINKKSASDNCQNESGGPLVFKTGSDYFIRYILVGISSSEKSCNDRTPEVYTRISSYIDWIESVVWPSGKFKNT